MPRVYIFSLLLVLAVPLARADIGPPRPAPPPPAGPAEAKVRGVNVVQGYGYWMGRRWLTYLDDCPASVASCKEIRASGARSCLVTAVDGRPLGGGDIAALLAAEKSATGRPIRLKLESCGPFGELVLQP